MCSFSNRAMKSTAALDIYINKLKKQNREFKVEWSIITETTPYKASTGKGRLCIREAIYILRTNTKMLINKISDAITACKHKYRGAFKFFVFLIID